MSDGLKWYILGIIAGVVLSLTMASLILPDFYYHKGIKAHYKGEYECAKALDKVVCREVEK